MAKTPEKWSLKVYGLSRPRYAEGNTLWRRDYPTRSAANRAAPHVRKMFPESFGELTRFQLAGANGLGFWTCRGNRGEDVFTLWGEE